MLPFKIPDNIVKQTDLEKFFDDMQIAIVKNDEVKLRVSWNILFLKTNWNGCNDFTFEQQQLFSDAPILVERAACVLVQCLDRPAFYFDEVFNNLFDANSSIRETFIHALISAHFSETCFYNILSHFLSRYPSGHDTTQCLDSFVSAVFSSAESSSPPPPHLLKHRSVHKHIDCVREPPTSDKANLTLKYTALMCRILEFQATLECDEKVRILYSLYALENIIFSRHHSPNTSAGQSREIAEVLDLSSCITIRIYLPANYYGEHRSAAELLNREIQKLSDFHVEAVFHRNLNITQINVGVWNSFKAIAKSMIINHLSVFFGENYFKMISETLDYNILHCNEIKFGEELANFLCKCVCMPLQFPDDEIGARMIDSILERDLQSKLLTFVMTQDSWISEQKALNTLIKIIQRANPRQLIRVVLHSSLLETLQNSQCTRKVSVFLFEFLVCLQQLEASDDARHFETAKLRISQLGFLTVLENTATITDSEFSFPLIYRFYPTRYEQLDYFRAINLADWPKIYAANTNKDIVNWKFSRGNSVLHWAVASQNIQVLEFFVRLHAINLDVANDQDLTPLGTAIIIGKSEMAVKLIKAGADITHLNSKMTAQTFSMLTNGSSEMTLLLNYLFMCGFSFNSLFENQKLSKIINGEEQISNASNDGGESVQDREMLIEMFTRMDAKITLPGGRNDCGFDEVLMNDCIRHVQRGQSDRRRSGLSQRKASELQPEICGVCFHVNHSGSSSTKLCTFCNGM